MAHPKALLFDVFGTVVDWRSGISSAVSEIAKKIGHSVDPEAFADAWRGLYQPSMQEVRDEKRPFTILDVLHRESLHTVLSQFSFPELSTEDEQFLVTAWHRLNGWPDATDGLVALKQHYIIAPQSNGNIALIVNMAKHSQLGWDLVLGAEVVSHYKPCPEAYVIACEKLGLSPQECMMVAAHNDDLAAAQAQGMMTAFILRPHEHGKGQKTDLKAEGAWNYCADDFLDLARQLEADR